MYRNRRTSSTYTSRMLVHVHILLVTRSLNGVQGVVSPEQDPYFPAQLTLFFLSNDVMGIPMFNGNESQMTSRNRAWLFALSQKMCHNCSVILCLFLTKTSLYTISTFILINTGILYLPDGPGFFTNLLRNFGMTLEKVRLLQL